MSKNDGGPAFPKAGLDPWGKAKNINIGMTLRDYFAAKAVTGMAGNDGADRIAFIAYQIADAMLLERAK